MKTWILLIYIISFPLTIFCQEQFIVYDFKGKCQVHDGDKIYAPKRWQALQPGSVVEFAKGASMKCICPGNVLLVIDKSGILSSWLDSCNKTRSQADVNDLSGPH